MKLPQKLAARCLALAGEKPVNPTAARSLVPDEGRLNRRFFGVTIPGLVVVSEANTGGKLRAKIARKAAVKEAISLALRELLPAITPPDPPFRVLLHRLGKRLLDDDNLAHAFKAVRDFVAEWLRVDDGDTARVMFSYSQTKSTQVGIKIEIQEV